jgi:hypothetical protein
LFFWILVSPKGLKSLQRKTYTSFTEGWFLPALYCLIPVAFLQDLFHHFPVGDSIYGYESSNHGLLAAFDWGMCNLFFIVPYYANKGPQE